MHTDAPPNNRLKLPTLILEGVGGCVLLVIGILNASLLWVVLGIVLLVVCLPLIYVTRQGRNPWWNRSPLDYRRRRHT